MINFATFDLNLLRVLDALLRTHSTVRAAHLLGLSQPAVSSALGRLRTALGDELFFRRGQGLEPTDFARSLEAPLHRQLEAIETLLSGPERFEPADSTARFRISGSDFFADMLMPDLAERLQDLAPSMQVHLVDLVPDSYLDTLDRYKVDLALVPALDLPDWVQSRKVFTSPFVAIARAGHPRIAGAGVAPGEIIPLDLYCELAHVLFSPEGNPTAMGDAALAAIGRKRRVVMTMPVFSGVYRAVAGSELIALLPAQLAAHVAAQAGLDIFEPPMPIAAVQIVMVWHRRLTTNPAHRWIRRQVAELLARLDAPD